MKVNFLHEDPIINFDLRIFTTLQYRLNQIDFKKYH